MPTACGPDPSGQNPLQPVMARHSKPKSAGSSDPALDISSLIDICFLLLIYFIATSVITPREQDLPVGLPRPGGDQSVATVPMLIRIDSAGTVSAAYGDVVQTLDADPGLRELPLLSAQLELYVSGVRAAGGDSAGPDRCRRSDHPAAGDRRAECAGCGWDPIRDLCRPWGRMNSAIARLSGKVSEPVISS